MPVGRLLVHAKDYEVEASLSSASSCSTSAARTASSIDASLTNRVQPLELAFRHRVEVDTANAFVDTRALQPTKENLGSTGIRDCALS